MSTSSAQSVGGQPPPAGDTTPQTALDHLAEQMSTAARQAARELAITTAQTRNAVLRSLAQRLAEKSQDILAANQADLAAGQDLSAAMKDRLRLDQPRLDKIARSVLDIAAQADPVGHVLEGRTLDNGARLERRRVPLGVICIIFESRPNVVIDAAALCIKSANAGILRGGRECQQTNAALGQTVSEALEDVGLPPDCVQVVQNPDRALVPALLARHSDIDLVIPRGGEGLIRAVVEHSRIPVIKHYTGNCHLYIHATMYGHDASFERMARELAINAKCQRPGVCNAVETILFDVFSAPVLLAKVCGDLVNRGVTIRGCPRTRELFADASPATEDDWSAEYLDLIVAVRVVNDVDHAIEHINHYGSHHTDAIVTADALVAERFVARVDSASVMVNCSTRLADGGVYGLGAEIGISTDKLHARGPMGAADLCTSKWVLTGSGQLRT